MTMRSMAQVCGLALMVLMSMPGAVQAQGAPAFGADGALGRPADYREWVFLTTGLGMTYGPAKDVNPNPMFDNVFVTPAAYRAFMQTGAWPEKTMFILEVREAQTNVSINNGGHTQGKIVAVEAAVKDSARFPGGWGYFTFDGPKGLTDKATALPQTATCYRCHSANTAVENTFVQFYPTLMEVATARGTVKKTYDPKRKVE